MISSPGQRLSAAFLAVRGRSSGRDQRDRYTTSNGLGELGNTTNSRRLFARLKATYNRHLASTVSGKVFASQGITMTPSHSSPLALWIVLIALAGG